jgi:cytidylate kinase
MIQAIAVEREFGCGGSEIASLLAQRLGWSLWDERLTQEIARLTKSSPEVVDKIGWRKDPAIYQVFLSFLRGAFEGGLPPTNRLALLDARRIAAVSESAINQALAEAPCVIVGRGSQYFLRNRKDVFRTFLYASRDYKIHRLVCGGVPERDAIEQVDTTDKDRAAFVKKYLKLDWPGRHLFNAMFNTEMGQAYVVEILAHCVQQVASREKIPAPHSV